MAPIGFELKSGHFTLSFSGGVNIILNEKYVGFAIINSGDIRNYEAGAPINYFDSLNLGYTF